MVRHPCGRALPVLVTGMLLGLALPPQVTGQTPPSGAGGPGVWDREIRQALERLEAQRQFQLFLLQPGDARWTTVVPGRDEKLAFRERLTLNLEAWLAWIGDSEALGDDQLAEARRRMDRIVDWSSVRYETPAFTTRAAATLGGDYAYAFLIARNPTLYASSLEPTSLYLRLEDKVLSPRQSEIVWEAVKRRTERHHRTVRNHVFGRIISAGELDAKQAGLLRSEPAFRECPWDSPPEALGPALGDVAQWLAGLMRAEHELELTGGQWELLELDPDYPSAAPAVVLGQNREEGEAALERTRLEYRKNLLTRYGTLIEHFAATRQLDEQASSRLWTAAKGSSQAIVCDWAKDARVEMAQSAQANEQLAIQQPMFLGLSMTAKGLRVSSAALMQHAFWKSAVDDARKRFPRQPARPEDLALQRSECVEVILTMLDQELWLTERQVAQLLPLVDESLPVEVPGGVISGDLPLVAALAYPLLRCPPQQRAEILNPVQSNIWAKLAEDFRLEQSPDRDRLTLRGRDGEIAYDVSRGR